MLKRVRLVIYVGNNPAPFVLQDVKAAGIPPSDLHVMLSVAQLQLLMGALGEQITAKATKAAGEAIGAALVGAWNKRRRKLPRSR